MGTYITGGLLLLAAVRQLYVALRELRLNERGLQRLLAEKVNGSARLATKLLIRTEHFRITKAAILLTVAAFWLGLDAGDFKRTVIGVLLLTYIALDEIKAETWQRGHEDIVELEYRRHGKTNEEHCARAAHRTERAK